MRGGISNEVGFRFHDPSDHPAAARQVADERLANQVTGKCDRAAGQFRAMKTANAAEIRYNRRHG
jgi:hypothetical protein